MWQRLQERASSSESGKIYNSYDIVGDIAIIKVPNDNMENAKHAAQAIMKLYPERSKQFFCKQALFKATSGLGN